MKKLFGLLLMVFAIASIGRGQAISVNGGSIQGTITDSTGAVVPNAAITILGTETGFSKNLSADQSGFYSVGPLNPGEYTVNVSATGFQKLSVKTVVRTGTATSGNFKLTVGSAVDTVEVNAGALQINTEQAGVSGVITQKQFDTLPVNGRNFLDFAQLQPGVQLQAGGSDDGGFDPTKAGYSALSFGGISGRTTRIQLDGQDITDETVGTTIFNVSEGSVGEMQVNRSTGDVSNDITSSGSVLASTRSGTNGFHGQAFYNFQDHRVGFATVEGIDPPFQRNQFGGSVGGPILRDKLFFFANAERLKQDQSAASQLQTGTGSFFSGLLAKYPQIGNPARDTYSAGRLDYNGPRGTHFFARVNYEVNAFSTGANYSLYANRDNAPGIAGGADFATGRVTHSFRGSYEKFHNFIADQTIGNQSSIYNPINGFGIVFGAQGLQTGPNPNAPQATFQSDKQLRYDGSMTRGQHNIRFGGSLNRILGGGLASFFGYGPYASINTSTLLPGGDPTDPVNGYRARYVYIGNGQGFASERPGFGLPGGFQGDWRTGFYLTDAWKIRPTFTLTFGARYDRDTGRTNADLGVIPCSAINAAQFGAVPCTGNSPLLDQWGTGLGQRVPQPNRNVAPQIGFAYNPAASPKTVLRGAIGVFFESNVFNNVQFDRASRLTTGRFASYPLVCLNGTYKLPIAGGTITQNSKGVSIQTMCNESLGAAAADFIQLEKDSQTAAAATTSSNPNFVGESLSVQNGNIAYSPKYQSPYSINFNFGLQQQVWNGAVLSADYVHVGSLRIQQTIDANHTGDSRYFNSAAALNAISTTTSSSAFPCGGGTGAAAINCAIAAGATISDFAGNGLDSGVAYLAGTPASNNGLDPTTGAAFPGANPGVGVGIFSFPTGKAAYDGLQINFRQQKTHPVRGIADTNVEVSYAYSRFITTTGPGGTGSTSDSFFSAPSWDNRNATQYMGYGGLDRTHILSMGGSFNVIHGPRIGFIGHFNTSAPTDLRIDSQGDNAGEIFRSDVTGDGTTNDLVPGTNPGAYSRKYGPNNLNKLINGYNATQAGTLTPAGQTLLSSGFFSAAQLNALGAAKPFLQPAAGRTYPNSPLRQLDLQASYPIRWNKLPEGLSLEPSVSMYNVLNLGNFAGPDGNIQSTSDYTASGGSVGFVNGDYDGSPKNSSRTLRRTGTFAQGAPRTTEFQLKLNF